MEDPWPASCALVTSDKTKAEQTKLGNCGIPGLLSEQPNVVILACHGKMATS